MSINLQPHEFHQFFQALYGADPFPWQKHLAETVFTQGWPSALDIPTSAGKTAAIDIAVFHLALDATNGPQRRAAVRILFVVDRRLIVDGAFDRALSIANKLADAKDGILRRVAERLRILSEDEQIPLRVARLRGGMPKEPDWVRTPAQPVVVVSTVDQVGSRFLFRGYGVSDSMKPIHAGLLGNDSLLLLDEAHLSQPFVQTARDTLMFRAKPWSEEAAAGPFAVVTLSATHAHEPASDEPFRITDEDRGDPRLRQRLSASKPAELRETKAGENALEMELADRAWELAARIGNGCVVAVVVNRVKRARAIFDKLQEKGARPFAETFGEPVPSPEAALLIGRTRALDRDGLLEALLPFVQAGSGRRSRTTPLILVATQCIEAGADLDFDGLVTEIAPLDCLRQRFGRLNRMGRPIGARAVIIAAADQIKKSAPPDPIYDKALLATWHLLVEKSEARSQKESGRSINFGIEHAASWVPTGEALKEFLAPRKDAPVLLPSAIASWSRTSPVPAADPDLALYLHGPKSSAGDVEIVWRADLDDAVDETQKEELWKERVWVCPPSGLEAIAVPIAEARRWLDKSAGGDISDTEGAGDEEYLPRSVSSGLALRWRGKAEERTGLIAPDQLRPGEVIIVPAARGGCDRWGWAPNQNDPVKVRDLGRQANLRQRDRDILRLTQAELSRKEVESATEMADSTDAEIFDQFQKYFEELDGIRLTKPRVIRSTEGRPLAIERKLFRPRKETPADSVGDAVTEDEESLRNRRQKPILLSEHSIGVERYARRYAEQAGLPSNMVGDIELAAYLHDAGKAQVNFKCLLYDGDELAAFSGPDLAKGAKLPDTPRAWEEVRKRAGLPKGARHEVASLRFAEEHSRFAAADDPDLVLWLIGTHHGYGRPFFPSPEWDWPGEGTTFETDLGDYRLVSKPALSMAGLTAVWLDLSEKLQRRYGVWGLARLEAILRLADHRRSGDEQEEDLAK